MDIHRSRFIPYPPSAINALAFSHSTNSNDSNAKKREGGDQKCLRLAIGRANGNIEIWNPAKGAWLHELTLFGGRDRSVEGLAWTQNPDDTDKHGKVVPGRLRLFSIGYSSTVTEWNLLNGLPLRHSSGNHSEVWCLTAQPRQFELAQDLVVGCADGTLAILSTSDDDLQFSRYLSRTTAKKARVLSVCYQNNDNVVAGFADSFIRVYNTRTCSEIKSMSLGSGKDGPKETLVWTVMALPNGDIVSGDSRGEVRVYDGKNFSQIRQLQTHEADVLALGISVHNNLFFSGGMDRRTVVYSQSMKETSKGSIRSLWSRQTHQRFHNHDIKAMATYEGTSLNILVSGGLDISPNVVPIKEFGEQNNRILPLLPQRPPLISSPSQRLVMSWWDREVRLWTFPPKEQETAPKLVARVVLKGEENITCAALRYDGRILALGTAAETKLFQLKTKATSNGEFKVRELKTAHQPAARILRFSPDGKWLVIVTPSSNVQLLRLLGDAEQTSSTSVLTTPIRLQRSATGDLRFSSADGLNGTWGRYNQNITLAEFSSDSRVLVTADIGGVVERWLLEGHEDTTAPDVEPANVPPGKATGDDSDSSEDEDDEDARGLIIRGQHWTPVAVALPSLDSTPLVLTFRPLSVSEHQTEPNGNPAVHPTRHNPHPYSHDLHLADNRLVVITARHRIYEFDVERCMLTDWARRNTAATVPSGFKKIRDLVMGSFWDCQGAQERLWMYGSSWLYMFDLSKDFADYPELQEYNMRGEKRSHEDEILELQKESTGAGSVVDSRQQTGLGRKIRKITVDGQDQDMDWVQKHREPRDLEDEDGDLASLSPLQHLTAHGGDLPNGDAAILEKTNDAAGPSMWHTYKYRPILGITPLSHREQPAEDGEKSSTGHSAPLEVVLVERPFWDLQLPPRFEGIHDRNR